MPPTQTPIGGGFTEGELKFASFWVRNRVVLTRTGYGLLLGLNILLGLYIAWGILDAFAISYPRESRITQEIAANQLTLASLEQDRPKNVSTGNVMVFESTDGRFDMAVDIENPNAQWWAEFTYRFNLSGEPTPLRNGFIMPGTRTTMTELGFRPKARAGPTAQLVVDSIRWHRVDPSQVGARYQDYALSRFNVAFEDVTFEGGRTSFDLVNRGSFGYWALDLVVKLYRGGSVVGVNKITLTDIIPGETRHIDLDWFERLPSVTRTEIVPVINLLDREIFLPTEFFRQR